VCSSQNWQPPPAPAIAEFTSPSEPVRARPVWVHLEKVCPHDPAHARTITDGLDMTGRARGMLLDWHRSARGEWLGVVHYQVHYADGRPKPLIFRDQLVPLHALEQRADSAPLG
jgi:hypothetical protein